jgi:hypothetical protein
VTLPRGVEISRLFLSARRDIDSDTADLDPDDRGDASVHEQYAVIGIPSTDDAESQEVICDIQVAPSAGIWTALFLSLVMAAVSGYVFQNIDDISADATKKQGLVDIATLLAAVPALAAGGLAYRGEAFARHMNRGPRILVAILSGLGATLAVVIGLAEIGELAKWLSWAVSVYAIFAAVVFAIIVYGPRYRKSDRSRRRDVTARKSPGSCQRAQMAWAVGLLTAAVIVGAAVGTLEVVL